MYLPVFLTTLFILPFTAGEREVLCAGKEFRLPVYSTSRTVTFTPDSGEPKRVLLENISVKDPRFKLTKGRMLVLREVTESDQGRYSIKLSSGFTYETVQLKVLDCIASYQRYYGETFKQNIPENASLLEFSPRGAPAEAMPVVLWKRTDPEARNASRGRLEQGGKVWVAEGVSQADQGNYTMKNVNGNVLSQSRLTVRAHFFNFTRLIKESINFPLLLPHGNLVFIPAQYPQELDSRPRPHYGLVQLIHEGKIMNSDLRYRGLISFKRNGSNKEVVIVSLTLGHSGVYEIRDKDGNLVSSAVLQVVEKQTRWKSVYNSISASSGLFLSMTGLILFLKRYPSRRISQLTTCFRRRRKPAVNPPRVNIHDYSQASTPPSGSNSNIQQPGTSRKWTPRSSPSRTAYSPVMLHTPKAQNQELHRLRASDSPCLKSASNEEERTISFFVPGSSDNLHSSEDCIRFPVKKDIGKGKPGKSHDYFSALPLDINTSESSSVYTSEKLNIYKDQDLREEQT